MLDNNCKYCQKEDLYIVENDEIYRNKELMVKIYDNKLLVEMYATNGDIVGYEIPTILCPMCGRKLQNED